MGGGDTLTSAMYQVINALSSVHKRNTVATYPHNGCNYWVYQPQDKQRSVQVDLTKATTEPWPVTMCAVIAHCLSTLHNETRGSLHK